MIEKTAKFVPCHCCGKQATTESSGFPVCAECAKTKEKELKAEQNF